VLAATPGLRDVLPMRRAHADVRAGLHRGAAAMVLRDRAMEVSGVRSVRVRVGRTKVDVRAVSHFRELDDVRADLDATLADGIRGSGSPGVARAVGACRPAGPEGMSRMLRIVNRVLLGLAGLLLVVFGGSVLAVGLGVNPPSWWIHDGRHDVLLSDADRRTRWRDDGWWWPTVIAVLAVARAARPVVAHGGTAAAPARRGARRHRRRRGRAAAGPGPGGRTGR
jgi:hypothetical protein